MVFQRSLPQQAQRAGDIRQHRRRERGKNEAFRCEFTEILSIFYVSDLFTTCFWERSKTIRTPTSCFRTQHSARHRSDVRQSRRREWEKFEGFGVNYTKNRAGYEWPSDLPLVFQNLSETSGHGYAVFVRDLPQHVQIIFASASDASENIWGLFPGI